MPNVEKCQPCRESKVGCSREGKVWNELDPQTKCNRCKEKDLDCGPDEYKKNDRGEPEGRLGMGQRSGAADIRGVQLLAPVPNRLEYRQADLRRRLHELDDSEVFHITRQDSSLGPYDRLQNVIIPEELLRILEDIEKFADLAHASNDISNAEVAYIRLIDWYSALGLDVSQHRQKLFMKVGRFYESTGLKHQAELYYLKIFDDILRRDEDINTPFHHAIRNFNTKGQVSQDALMRIIRCCPPCRFQLRNGWSQTPLLLAVSTTEERIIIAIMNRLRDRRRQFKIDPLHLNTRDCQGLTVITTAILAGCSLPLIDALIKYGSNVNPQKLGGCNPLQAASIPGSERIDVAWLLIQHQANQNDVCPGSTVAMQMVNGLPEPTYIPLRLELDQPPDEQDNAWI